MHSCPFCDVPEFMKESELDRHVVSEHPKKTSVFDFESQEKLHEKKRNLELATVAGEIAANLTGQLEDWKIAFKEVHQALRDELKRVEESENLYSSDSLHVLEEAEEAANRRRE